VDCKIPGGDCMQICKWLVKNFNANLVDYFIIFAIIVVYY
jgi:hypothetical protein